MSSTDRCFQRLRTLPGPGSLTGMGTARVLGSTVIFPSLAVNSTAGVHSVLSTKEDGACMGCPELFSPEQQ